MFKDHHYMPLPSCLQIQIINEIKGHGLVATRNIPAGSYLGVTSFMMTHDTTIYTGKDASRTPLGGFINHSDRPNCAVLAHPELERAHELGRTWHLWTIMPVHQDEELTVFYTDCYEDLIDNWEGPANLSNQFYDDENNIGRC